MSTWFSIPFIKMLTLEHLPGKKKITLFLRVAYASSKKVKNFNKVTGTE